MRTLFAAMVGVSALGLAVPAAAQSTDGEFNGPYVGGSFGYSVQSNDVGESILFDRNLDGRFGDTIFTPTNPNAFSPGFCNGAARGATRLPGGCANDRDDIEYNVRAGWDSQFGNIVVGVVGEFGKSEIRDSVTGFSTTPANYIMTRELDWAGSVRGRVGYAANKTLFYGAMGPAYARINNSFSSSQSTNTFTPNDRKTESWGFTAGGGVEQKLGNNFSIGLEYMFSRYQDDDYRIRTSGGPANGPFVLGNAAGTDFRRSNSDFEYHNLRATAAFRF